MKKKANSSDPLAPSSDSEGLCGGLHTATIATVDLAHYVSFYVEGLGMTLEGPIQVEKNQLERQRKLWDIPQEIQWETYLLYRPAVSGHVQIRLIVLDQATPQIHQSFDSRELGPFSLGFPNGDQAGLDATLRQKGFQSMAPLQEGRVERPDGSAYRYIETIYQAPDFLHVVGIERKDGMPQLAPIDPQTNLGGPGYSAMVVDNSDTMLAFLTNVLDLELRADRIWESSPGSALGIEAGISFRFALVYPKGGQHNHLLFLDYKDGKFIPLQVPPRIPNRGLGMWTFQTHDIDQVHKKAMIYHSYIVHGPINSHDPLLGPARVMTLLAPNGFLIEVFQPN